MQFITSTNGLTVRGHGYPQPKQVRVQYYRDREQIVLESVSAVNLGRMKGVALVRITPEQFESRPSDPYDSAREAQWALRRCGWWFDSGE